MGKLYKFSSTSSMVKTLERYEKCSFGPSEQRKPAKEDFQEQSSYQEYMRLKERYDALKQLERQEPYSLCSDFNTFAYMMDYIGIPEKPQFLSFAFVNGPLCNKFLSFAIVH